MIILRSIARLFALLLPAIWVVVWLVSPCNSVWPMGCGWFYDMVEGGIVSIYGGAPYDGGGTYDIFR